MGHLFMLNWVKRVLTGPDEWKKRTKFSLENYYFDNVTAYPWLFFLGKIAKGGRKRKVKKESMKLNIYK